MGNVAIAIRNRARAGSKRLVYFDLTFSAAYAANGDTIVANDIAKLIPEMADLAQVDLFVAEIGPGGHEAFLDRANKKVKAFNGTTEIVAAVNLSAVVMRCKIEYGASPGAAG